jgi:hypothetical protein
MRPDSDKYYCYQWYGRMRWACVGDATGIDFNWVLARILGRIVPGQDGSWDKYQNLRSIANLVSCLIIGECLSCKYYGIMRL